MELVAQLRDILSKVDPSLLGKDDRLALIDLLNKTFHLQAASARSVDGPAA